MTKAPEKTVELDLPIDKACFFIFKARELDVKVAPSGLEDGSNATDDNMATVLEDTGNDAVAQELTSIINDLNSDEQIDLVALMWLGRDKNSADDWPELRREAARLQDVSCARYPLGTPMLGDYIEEGLSILGHSCSQYIIDRM